MKLSSLKIIRVSVSIIFFLLLSALFLDFSNALSPAYTNYFTFLQFVPSVIKFISLAGITAAGFAIVLVLTAIFGRVYCSSICPMGTLQDVFSFISKRLRKKKYYRLLKPANWLRYSLLSLSVIFILAGSLFIINLLDPYSNYGRMLTGLFKPIILYGYNFISITLEKFNLYWINPVEIRGTNHLVLIYPAAFLLAVFILSFFSGRLFCNTICPVGSLLGLLSKLSIFKIKIDAKNCISCNLCERACKSGCIDKKNKVVDFSRCVTCYNCIRVCPTEGITYKFTYDKKSSLQPEKIDSGKRKFLISVGVFIAGSTSLMSAQSKIISKKLSKIAIFRKHPVTPPGSISLDHFTANCTACHLCVSACPTQVLQPSFLEYGILGINQPRMDYVTSFCNLECVICSEVCPSGAILPIKPEKKKLTQLGQAKFIKDNCIVYTEKTDCGACSEHCPTKAVIMVPYGDVRAPEVHDEYCIGCGACEYACPVKPYKAIYVDANIVHKAAQKKEDKKIEKKINYNDDFPF
jgi:ferredoxin-type protein NapF